MAGGGVGEAMLLGAAMGGGSAAITGGDPLKGALLGGITGGIGGGIGGVGATAAETAGTAAATQAGTQAATNAAMSNALPLTSSMTTPAVTAVFRLDKLLLRQANWQTTPHLCRAQMPQWLTPCR